MDTTAGSVIPGVVAMSAREVKALHDRIAELEAALRARDDFLVGKGLWLEFVQALNDADSAARPPVFVGKIS